MLARGTHALIQRSILELISTPKALGTGAELMATQKLPSEALETPSGRPGRLSKNNSKDPACNKNTMILAQFPCLSMATVVLEVKIAKTKTANEEKQHVLRGGGGAGGRRGVQEIAVGWVLLVELADCAC